jgi:hypothetical protein
MHPEPVDENLQEKTANKRQNRLVTAKENPSLLGTQETQEKYNPTTNK